MEKEHLPQAAKMLDLLHRLKTGDIRLEKALQTARTGAKKFLHCEQASDTLLDGRAGYLLVLLHLHALSEEKWLLNLINQFIGKIIKNAQSDGSGIFWSRTNHNSRPECGYGYGVSGIGHVFMELGFYFRNKAFYYIAEKAFSFVKKYLPEEDRGRLDYKKEIQSVGQYHQHRQQFLAGNIAFFSDPDEVYEGMSGVIPSRITSPCKDPAETEGYPFISLRETEIKKIILQKDFNRAVYLLEYLAPGQLHAYLQVSSQQDGAEAFIAFVEGLVPSLDERHQAGLRTVLDLERRKMAIAGGIANGAYLHVKEIFRMEEVAGLLSCSEEDFKDRWIETGKDVTLIPTSSRVRFFAYVVQEGDYIPQEEENTVLLKPTTQWHFSTPNGDIYDTFPFRDGPSNVMELHLNSMQRRLLAFLQEPRKAGSAVQHIVAAFAEEDPSFIEKAVIQQIRDFLRAGILNPSTS